MIVPAILILVFKYPPRKAMTVGGPIDTVLLIALGIILWKNRGH